MTSSSIQIARLNGLWLLKRKSKTPWVDLLSDFSRLRCPGNHRNRAIGSTCANAAAMQLTELDSMAFPNRLHIDVRAQSEEISTLADDVRRGLTTKTKSLPPKYFYDERGSQLFDEICRTPEYYPTRVECSLLEQFAEQIIRQIKPSDIVELGSGMARKTWTLLDAAQQSQVRCRYIPFDVSRSAVSTSASHLLDRYPWLTIHGVVGDYDRHLSMIPQGQRRLFLFLGGTVGNFETEPAVDFLKKISSLMSEEDFLLMGTDLVKDDATLNAAYNDSQGLTADFNKNVLHVINRELDGDFNPDQFRHRAFFNRPKSRIEMHLESLKSQSVKLRKIDVEVNFDGGETILTEISRKFTRSTVVELLSRADLSLVDWFTPDNEYFGLSLSKLR